MSGETVKSQSPNPKTQIPIEDAARAMIASALASAKKPCITSSFQAECVVLTGSLAAGSCGPAMASAAASTRRRAASIDSGLTGLLT